MDKSFVVLLLFPLVGATTVMFGQQGVIITPRQGNISIVGHKSVRLAITLTDPYVSFDGPPVSRAGMNTLQEMAQRTVRESLRRWNKSAVEEGCTSGSPILDGISHGFLLPGQTYRTSDGIFVLPLTLEVQPRHSDHSANGTDGYPSPYTLAHWASSLGVAIGEIGETISGCGISPIPDTYYDQGLSFDTTYFDVPSEVIGLATIRMIEISPMKQMVLYEAQIPFEVGASDTAWTIDVLPKMANGNRRVKLIVQTEGQDIPLDRDSCRVYESIQYCPMLAPETLTMCERNCLRTLHNCDCWCERTKPGVYTMEPGIMIISGDLKGNCLVDNRRIYLNGFAYVPFSPVSETYVDCLGNRTLFPRGASPEVHMVRSSCHDRNGTCKVQSPVESGLRTGGPLLHSYDIHPINPALQTNDRHDEESNPPGTRTVNHTEKAKPSGNSAELFCVGISSLSLSISLMLVVWITTKEFERRKKAKSAGNSGIGNKELYMRLRNPIVHKGRD